MLRGHKTKIVCTLGPASESPEVLARMIAAGMDVARLNFSHGSFDDHGTLIDRVREASRAAGRPVAILADLPGPKLRIGRVDPDPVVLEGGAAFVLTTTSRTGDSTGASVDFPGLPDALSPGDRISLSDGMILLRVEEVAGPEIRCRVAVGGELGSMKGLNVPGVDLGVSAFTDRDRECLRFALDRGADLASLSFVASAADLDAAREAARAAGHEPFLVAKIERAAALSRIDEILGAADGVMVARGDLGVEIPVERIAVEQKRLVDRAVALGKPVITATHMLESMVAHRRPTRAEATDVANAILDGTDAVMLSAESAVGRFPVESVEMLAAIAAATEPHRPEYRAQSSERALQARAGEGALGVIAGGVRQAFDRAAIAAVVVPTLTGATARSIARFRLPVWIAAPSPLASTCRRLLLSYGVAPSEVAGDAADWTPFARRFVRDHGLPEGLVLLVEGPSPDHPEVNHRMEVLLP